MCVCMCVCVQSSICHVCAHAESVLMHNYTEVPVINCLQLLPAYVKICVQQVQQSCNIQYNVMCTNMTSGHCVILANPVVIETLYEAYRYYHSYKS